MFDVIFNNSILLKAKEKNKVKYNIYNLFNYLDDFKQRIDDYPFGGIEGMLLKPEPIFNALQEIDKVMENKSNRIIQIKNKQKMRIAEKSSMEVFCYINKLTLTTHSRRS